MECVVRGYITGSAWEEYKLTGTINSRNIQSNIREGEKFSEPIFTPSTKATEGHDQPLSKSDGESSSNSPESSLPRYVIAILPGSPASICGKA